MSDELSKRIAALSPEKRKQLLSKLKKNNGGAVSNKIAARSRDANQFPLSFSQQRLWFLDQMEPDSATYNIPMAFRLTGSLHFQALEKTVNEIIKRHEALRTSFSAVNGQPVQTISAPVYVPLDVTDLTRFQDSERISEFERLASKEAKQPFNLAKGPLVRAALIKFSETEHLFFLTMHHIISDGWSIGVLLKELGAFYRAFANGEPVSLPELPIQYADFAVWQRNRLQGEELDKQLSFWGNELDGAPRALALPTDYPRPAVQTFPGAVQNMKATVSLTEKLNQLSRKQSVTLFMTLLTAFKILLSRYTGQEDVVVGSPIANRSRPEIENLIGFFVNTLVLRTQMGDNPTFLELLSKVHKTTMGAYAHQDLPFEKLVEEFQPQRDLSSTPFFQVMFILQNAPIERFELPGLTLDTLAGQAGTSRFDLSLYMGEGDGRLIGAIEYNTDLFDTSTIKRMLWHFETLLESIVENPNQRISELRMLTEAETSQLLQWNATETDYPSEQCFHHLFEAQAEKTPDGTAVIFEDTELTYRELNSRANQLAHHLKHLGVGPDVLVGICVERSLQMLVGLLGIMKAGGAYVPLDPSYPQERLAYMVEDARPQVLLTQDSLRQTLFEGREANSEEPFDSAQDRLRAKPAQKSASGFSLLGSQVLCLDSDWPEIGKASKSNPEIETQSSNLAYVIYTSGSTGKPKGVAIQHQTLVNFLISMQAEPGLTQEDTLVAVTTLSFDIAGLELYLPLIAGSKVILASREDASDGGRLSSLLTECAATVMQATPATWRMLIDSGWQGRANLKMLCGGEALPPELANRLLDTEGSLWNMYGPTETTIWSSVYELKSEGNNVPVGPPIANTRIYILDKNKKQVPVGVYGELYIGGDGLARGYLNRAELTAEKFVPNPFSTEAGARMYGTGDLARYLSDGSIELVGRIDHQVKIRGFRIELGEIEATLAKHEAIDEVVVVVRDDDQKGVKNLVAYLISKGKTAPTVSELRRFLQGSLPEYMVPTAFVFLNAFPLTPNGKVDRKALPAPDGVRPELEEAFVAPQNEVERTIAEIWQDVIGVKKVGVEDNFFDLGGHSLLLVQVQSKLTTVLSRDVSIIELFKYPTIKAQAKYFSLNNEDAADDRELNRAQDLAKKQREALARQKQKTTISN